MRSWRREQRERDEAAANARLGNLMGWPDDDPQDAAVDVVGWAKEGLFGSVKGSGHLCIDCSLDSPGPDFRAVRRIQLAATQPCTRCGRRLEILTRPGSEKK